MLNAGCMSPPVRTPRTLAVECFLVFAVLPGALALLKPHGLIYGLLWLLLVLCLRILRRDYAYDFRADWNASALRMKNIFPLLQRFVPLALILLAFVWWTIPEHFLSLPRRSLSMWAAVMLLYPLVSVLPQEFIFRSYFTRRYAQILPGMRMLVVNALAFGWAHAVMQNWVAVAFSAVGGYLFAHTYARHRSLALCCLEHALYGCFLFTIGMGYFFYHGAR